MTAMLLRRRHVLTLGLTASALAGCGFRPVYMPTATGQPGVAERELAAIDVGIIPERPGQLLRQSLQEHFASDGGGSHRYSLTVSYWVSGEVVGIQTDNSASHVRMVGVANWTLAIREAPPTRLTSGTARSQDGYNLFAAQYFASTLENEVVQKRLADAIADQMALQLATWFRARGQPAS